MSTFVSSQHRDRPAFDGGGVLLRCRTSGMPCCYWKEQQDRASVSSQSVECSAVPANSLTRRVGGYSIEQPERERM